MSVDSYVSRLEEARQRKDLDPRVRRALENALAAFLAYIDKIYLVHEAASSYYPPESVPIKPPTGSKKEGHTPRGRDGSLDRFMRREVRDDLNSLARTVDSRSQRIHHVLGGGTRRRAKLNHSNVREIRERRDETHTSLANEYGVSPATIRSVQTGKTWRQDA